MKKITFLIVSVFVMHALVSQPVLTNGINLEFGDTYSYDGYEGVTNIEPGSGGANQVWDFSNLSGYGFFEGINAIAVDPETTMFADSAAVADATMCTRNMDDPNSGPYQYYENNNTSQNLIAMAILGTSNSAFGTYTNPLKAFELPFAYNDMFIDDYEVMNFNIDQGYYFLRDSATMTVEADAYGTITTPLQEFQNVLRVKRTTTYYTWFRFQPGGDWLPNGPFTDVEYSWYAPNIKVPVMYIDVMEGFTDYPVRYLVDYNFTTSTEELAYQEIELFPNPTTDNITIKTRSTIDRIGIYSIQGQLLFTYSPLSQDQQQTIDLAQYTTGIYIVKIAHENGKVLTKKFVKQ